MPEDKLTVRNLYKQNIYLQPDAELCFDKKYRLPHWQKKAVEKQMNKMLKVGIIEPTKSEWSSSILLVPKKLDPSGKTKWRLVIDYRKLNDRLQVTSFLYQT